jgi:TPR repeat protein
LSDKDDVLGTYYLASLLRRKNKPQEAFELFKRAAELGHGSAAYWAYTMASGEYGLARDEAQLAYFLRKAASLGHVYAERDMARQELKQAPDLWAKIAAWVRYAAIKTRGLMLILRNHEDIRTR